MKKYKHIHFINMHPTQEDWTESVIPITNFYGELITYEINWHENLEWLSLF